MTSPTPLRGRCPVCAAAKRNRDVLIEYDIAAGRQAYAECPACESVVNPA